MTVNDQSPPANNPPPALVFITPTGQITLSAWLAGVNQLKQHLLNLPQQKWLLFESNSVSFSLMFFALLAAGKQVVLPPSDKQSQLLMIARQLDNDDESLDGVMGSSMIAGLPYISTPQCLTHSGLMATQLSLDQLAASHFLGQSIAEILSISDDAKIDFFTSGSTGNAKKITKSWSVLAKEINALEALWGETVAASLLVGTVSHQHIYGLIFTLLWPLFSGRVINSKMLTYPEELSSLLAQRQQAVTLVSSPAFLNRTAHEPLWQSYRASIATVFCSGGPLGFSAAQQLAQVLAQPPIEVLGSTETGGMAWRQQGPSTASYWRPFGQIAIRVGVDQRLEIQSPYLPDQQWYTTDDRVELRHNGQFELLTRADRVVKIEQKRLSLDELEQALVAHRWVAQCRAVVISGQRDQIAVAVVLSQQGLDAAIFTDDPIVDKHRKRQLNLQLRRHLSDYFEAVLLPRKWRYIESLPINSQGKLSHQAILGLFES